MATPKDRQEEDSWGKLAFWMGEENSGGQQGPFLFCQVECSLFHCQVVYVDLVNKKTTFTDPRLAFAKETVTASSTFRQKFDSGSTALQVLESTYRRHFRKQILFLLGGAWTGPYRPGCLGHWRKQWCWLANCSHSCLARLPGFKPSISKMCCSLLSPGRL